MKVDINHHRLPIHDVSAYILATWLGWVDEPSSHDDIVTKRRNYSQDFERKLVQVDINICFKDQLLILIPIIVILST